jgi:hypothetical protein
VCGLRRARHRRPVKMPMGNQRRKALSRQQAQAAGVKQMGELLWSRRLGACSPRGQGTVMQNPACARTRANLHHLPPRSMRQPARHPGGERDRAHEQQHPARPSCLGVPWHVHGQGHERSVQNDGPVRLEQSVSACGRAGAAYLQQAWRRRPARAREAAVQASRAWPGRLQTPGSAARCHPP